MTFYKKNKGVSLIEALVYVAILAVLVLVIAKSMTTFLGAYKNIREVRKLENSAISSMDRMIREIRNADSVDAINSNFDSSMGVLVLNTSDNSGNPMTVKFYVSDGRVYADENGVSLGPITATGINTTSLMFRLVSTPISEAVKVEMSFLDIGASPDLYRSFFGTALLRGSYE